MDLPKEANPLSTPSAAPPPPHPVGLGSERQVQAWRAWSDCGDGDQVQLVLDRSARQVRLLPAEAYPATTRSVR